MCSSAELIKQLGLLPHPEGGHYRETYRAAQLVATPHGPRAASTAILFLLGAGERSHWHRIRSDEAWHFHAGGPLLIHQLSTGGHAQTTRLGMDLTACGARRPVVCSRAGQ
jgi:predicted cupin superfamily sugar epimerase